MNKVFPSALDAVRDIPDGATLLAGGFGLCGIPENCIRALRELGTKRPHRRLEQLRRRRLRPRHPAPQQADREDGLELRRREQGVRAPVPSGELEVELTPQGTLAERLRAGGAGIPAFYTPTGAGTAISDGGPARSATRPTARVAKHSAKKETREFDGRAYVLEPAITRRLRAREGVEGRPLRQPRLPAHGDELQPDDGDRRQGRRSPRSRSSSRSATLDPDHVHTPGIYVHRIFQGDGYEKRIERRTTSEADVASAADERSGGSSREQHRAARRAGAARRLLRQPRHRHAHARRATTSRRASRSCSRARTACSASAPTRAEDGVDAGPHQRRQGDGHDAPGQRRSSRAPRASR